MTDRSDAILALKPNAQFRLDGDVLTWTDPNLSEPTTNQITAKYDELVLAEPLKELRRIRNIKLLETDWVVSFHTEKGTDIPSAWTTYRQALRDITSTTPNDIALSNITFPTKPS